ncbi:hypothetical protein Ciccas_007399 [Cichlidogyrus casuarinus]|uniref:SH3 domain-containing protein n=1 Tax=Cichlidogyrus casuarinus TaxID=1844966 RepID=A0ABD2Q3Q5_9PLAT
MSFNGSPAGGNDQWGSSQPAVPTTAPRASDSLMRSTPQQPSSPLNRASFNGFSAGGNGQWGSSQPVVPTSAPRASDFPIRTTPQQESSPLSRASFNGFSAGGNDQWSSSQPVVPTTAPRASDNWMRTAAEEPHTTSTPDDIWGSGQPATIPTLSNPTPVISKPNILPRSLPQRLPVVCDQQQPLIPPRATVPVAQPNPPTNLGANTTSSPARAESPRTVPTQDATTKNAFLLFQQMDQTLNSVARPLAKPPIKQPPAATESSIETKVASVKDARAAFEKNIQNSTITANDLMPKPIFTRPTPISTATMKAAPEPDNKIPIQSTPSSTTTGANHECWLELLHDFAAEVPTDLQASKGEFVEWLDAGEEIRSNPQMMVPDTWLCCRSVLGREGQIPGSYVRRVTARDELLQIEQTRPKACAIADFRADQEGDLDMKVGDKVFLFASSALDGAGWLRGQSSSSKKIGIFPANFVQVITPIPQ